MPLSETWKAQPTSPLRIYLLTGRTRTHPGFARLRSHQRSCLSRPDVRSYCDPSDAFLLSASIFVSAQQPPTGIVFRFNQLPGSAQNSEGKRKCRAWSSSVQILRSLRLSTLEAPAVSSSSLSPPPPRILFYYPWRIARNVKRPSTYGCEVTRKNFDPCPRAFKPDPPMTSAFLPNISPPFVPSSTHAALPCECGCGTRPRKNQDKTARGWDLKTGRTLRALADRCARFIPIVFNRIIAVRQFPAEEKELWYINETNRRTSFLVQADKPPSPVFEATRVNLLSYFQSSV